MFDADDPFLARLRPIALAMPESDERISHGRPTFWCRKIFAHYGGSIKGGPRHEHALLILPDRPEAAALASDGRFFVPAYHGPSGWLGIDLDRDDTDWGEIAELVDASFRRVAPTSAIAQLRR